MRPLPVGQAWWPRPWGLERGRQNRFRSESSRGGQGLEVSTSARVTSTERGRRAAGTLGLEAAFARIARAVTADPIA